MVRIETIKLNKSFDKNHVIKDLSFNVDEGELRTILGPSGCGKTTTLRLILGTLSPDSGQIYFGNEDVTSMPCYKRNVGIVYQDYALFPHLTVSENIAFGLKARKRANIEEKVNELMKLFQISGLEDRYPREISGGEKQRTALCRTLAVEPDIILLDEPLSNIDAKLRLDLRNEIKRINNEMGITIIYVTHDQEEALTISDKISIMRNGQIIETGKPEELLFNPKTDYTKEFMSVLNRKLDNLKEIGIIH